MPIENDSNNIETKPSGETSGSPPTPANPNANSNESSAKKLEEDIKRGEWWLIRIGIATLLINTGIGLIYWGQLREMQKATVAATQASQTAKDTLTEMQSGSGAQDTHTLAQQAVTQATQTTNLANDTHDLAQAAGRQADAAKILAENAKIQAEAAQRAANAAQASVSTAKDAMYAEQRPWVGIEVIPVSDPSVVRTTRPEVKASAFVIFAHNTGRTPALEWTSECCEPFERMNEFGETIPDYDTLHADIDRHISVTMRARINDGTETIEEVRDWIRKTQAEGDSFMRESQVITPGGFKEVQNVIQAQENDHTYHFVLGKFVYRDILDPTKEHVTKFCLVQLGNSDFRLCRTGQDMD